MTASDNGAIGVNDIVVTNRAKASVLPFAKRLSTLKATRLVPGINGLHWRNKVTRLKRALKQAIAIFSSAAVNDDFVDETSHATIVAFSGVGVNAETLPQ